jgi:hypothetical protein
MALVLDVATVAVVIAAVAFLLRGRKKCSDRAPRAGTQTRIPLAELRAAARRASGRD